MVKPRKTLEKLEGYLKKERFVILLGSRQVGKTTLALGLLDSSKKIGYLNWDIAKDRESFLKHELSNTPLWVFDEIHKYRGWRTYLKGVFDQFKDQKKILVTGSARLDFYRHGGDSLQGRYYYYRLHPLSFAELKMKTADELQKLLTLGGFPEPFFSGSLVESQRWRREYRTRLIQEDLLSLERVHDIGNLELLLLRLPELLGSPLSINGLREDLQVSHKTLSHWLTILERLYAIFRLSPFGSPKIRAVKKEQKHYHFDWTVASDPAMRFENLVACHLLKWVHFRQDVKGENIELRYFRDIDGREVDLIVEKDKEPILAIECKLSDKEISKSLMYFKEKWKNCEAWQISSTGEKDYLTRQGIYVVPATKFLKCLV